jgi:hypothetical protein
MAKGNRNHGPGGLIKRFVGNKNTVTILGILACVATLIIGYNYRVKISINPVVVPYAKDTIPARTLITAQMLGNIKIAKTYTQSATNLILDSKKVVGKYATYKGDIPKKSLIYTDYLVEAEDMPDAAFANIEDGYTIFSLDVSEKDTFYNQVRAGDYIDLYIAAKDPDEEDKIIFANMISSIRVLAVKDNKGNNIIKSRLENGKPSELLFAVEENMYLLLMKSQFVDLDIDIIPVLRNENYTKQAKDVQVTSDVIVQMIMDRCEEI